MILRRFMQHVREQNWFAVGLDLMIVVVGVFLGFQVTAWNSERQDRTNGAEIITRLHQEIEALGESRWDWAEARQSTRANLLSASTILFSDETGEISPEECGAIAQSHVFNSPTLILPVIAELESTGDLDLIRNDRVREAVTRYLLALSWAHEIDAAVNHEILNLAVLFPDYVRFELPDEMAGWDPVFDGSARCDTAAMRADPGFLNALADNISKSRYFNTAVLDLPNAGFEALHAAVDADLGIQHPETTE